jgi:TonB family protein
MQRLLMVGLFALLFTSLTAAQDVYRISEHVTEPKIVEMAKPRYALSPRRKQLEGVVGLEVDVLPDGTVGTVALVKSLDAEVDEIAAEAAKKFTFTPGTKDGKPVAVRIALDLQFNLRFDHTGPPMRLLNGSLPAPN